jgi:diaminopimelate decarboxylase
MAVPHAPAEDLKFLTEDQVVALSSQFPTPVFIYSEERIIGQIQKALAFPVNEGYGLTIRFAMKANPNKSILGIMKKHGVKIDASSEHEVHRAIAAGSFCSPQ